MKSNRNQSKNKIKRLALDALLVHLEEGIHIVDKEGVTLLYNQQMANLEGVDPKDIIGKPFLSVFEGFDQETSTIMSVLDSEKPMSDRIQHYVHKGKSITSINSTVPIMDGEMLIGAMEVAKDVTKIRQLADQVAELTQLVHGAEVEEVDEDKKRTSLHPYTFSDILGVSKVFLKSVERAKKAAENSATVLIYGETGTGKELIAQSIHNASERRTKPFIAQNCAAIPESLLEGILFGTVRGSFTGAIDRPGLFEQADRGTLLLDEINSMGMNLQAKLLRVLQEGYVRRVGGQKDIRVDVRIIATINEKPENAMIKGQLRRDLYYRLSVLNIQLPRLEERIEDFDLLADYFTKKYAKEYGKDIWMISKEVREKLQEYHWPGNVREFENVIQSMVSLLPSDEHVLKEEHFPSLITRKTLSFSSELPEDMGLEELLSEIEREKILQALTKTSGNIAQAAELLKIKRQTLQHKLKKHEISAK